MKKPLENRRNLILGFTFIFYQDCRGYPLVGVRLVYKRKAQESVSVTVLQPEASRIALSKLDGNAEAHACICKRCIRLYLSRETPKAEYYIPTGIYRCSFLDLDRNFARISGCQESARINAFKMSMPKFKLRHSTALAHNGAPQFLLATNLISFVYMTKFFRTKILYYS